jgi:solute carrier family 39 (zinc transporter), member 1/2/3
MFSALVVVALEMFLTTRGAGHSHSHTWDAVLDEDDEETHLNGVAEAPQANGKGRSWRPRREYPSESIPLDDVDASEGLVAGVSPLPVSAPMTNGPAQNNKLRYENSEDGSDLDLNELDPTVEPFPDAGGHDSNPSRISPPAVLSHEEEQRRLVLQCLLLEAGILFHSIFIGMAVSVATGPPFVVFLVAIAFHQSFEGLALGSRIAAISFPPRSPRPWLMVLAYGTTTPIGQAIGLVVHKMYDPQSAAGLLMVGFMNGISSGLLLFAGLVQLLAEDFLSDKSYGILKGRRRWEAFAAVISGATLMSLVGAFA